MESAEQTFARLVADRLKAMETNAFAAETTSGLPEDAIRSIIRGTKKSGTTLNRVQAVCEALGIDFRIGGTPLPRPVEQIVVDGADFAHIPVHEAFLSAGPGVANGDVAVIEHLVFRQDWLNRVGITPEKAALARVSGDSMSPGIQQDDLVLIDCSRRDIPVRKRTRRGNPAPIYAFIQDGEARVKRIERPEANMLVLLSDNPSFPPELVIDPHPDSIKILGQVVWSGHVWK